MECRVEQLEGYERCERIWGYTNRWGTNRRESKK
jgi:hypothetical protein